MPVRDRLRILAAAAWQEFWRVDEAALSYLCRPSVPILFFGDSERYAASPLRVVTVGKNPSDGEFRDADTFAQFYGRRALSGIDVDSYLGRLDDYFRGPRPHPWFDSYEPVLRGAGSSYHDGAPSAALHTDLCTPLATSPTWSKLNADQQMTLRPNGLRLWHDLIEALEPDIVFISVRRDLLAKIEFRSVGSPLVVERQGVPYPYELQMFQRRLASGKRPLFVFGSAAQTPFGKIAAVERQRMGAAVRQFQEALTP